MNSQPVHKQGRMRTDIILEQESSLRDILNVIFRHRNKILIFFSLVFLSVLLFTFLTPETFQSDAKLLIRVGRENVAMDPTVTGPTLSLSQSRENEVNSELSIIRSRVLAERVVDTLGPDLFVKGSAEPDAEEMKAQRKRAVKYFMGNLQVEVEKKSHIISLHFLAPDVELAQKSLDLLLKYYLEKHIEVNRMQATPQFFRDQAGKLYSELAAKEKELEGFKRAHHITSIESQKDSLTGQIDTLQNSLDRVTADINSSRARVASLTASLGKSSPIIELGRTTGLANNAADALKGRLLELQLEEADLAERFQDDYRPLVDIRNQIRLTETALSREEETRTEVTSGLDTNYQAMQLDLENEKSMLEGLIAQKDALERELAMRRKKAAELVNHEATITKLQREIMVLENGYIEYQNNLQRANISTALDIDNVSNVSIVQPATLPLTPVRPNKKLNLALGLFLGLFGGLGLAFLVDYLDDTLKTNEDVQKRLGLPVLAAVSKRDFEACT